MDWYTLKFLPNNKFVKYVGIWLFILPPILRILHEYNIIAITVKWGFVFFAALCFAIANVIYTLSCPKIIKDHISFTGFLGDGKTKAHLEEYKKEIDDVKIKISCSDKALRIAFGEIQQKALKAKYLELVICMSFYILGFFWILCIILIETSWVIYACSPAVQKLLQSICL